MVRIEIVPFRERSGAIVLRVETDIDGERFTFQKAISQPDFESLFELVMREATSAIKAKALEVVRAWGNEELSGIEL